VPAPPTPTPKADYSSYQSQIQRVCGFSNPAGVWVAIEQHSSPDALYRNLADNLSRSKSRQDFKNVIQARCNFGTPSDVWIALERRVW